MTECESKIAGRNRIFPPLRIGCKTIENKSSLDRRFMNFNLKSPKYGAIIDL